jgi:hypothetical protein
VVCVGTPVRALVTRRLGLIELSSSRGLGLRIGTVKCRFLLGRNETEVEALTKSHLALTSVDTMDTQQKRKRDEYESDLVTFMRIGTISILDVLAVKLPDVFAGEILPKLDLTETLNLAQVNKTFNAAVWSVGGVRSLEAKIEARMMKLEKKKGLLTEPLYWAAHYDNVPAVRALLESGVDVNKIIYHVHGQWPTALYLAAEYGHVAVVKLLIEKGADLNERHVNCRTPLSVAAHKGNSLCVMELLKAGADVNLATSPNGNTPLMCAVRGREAIVALLVHYGADVSSCNHRGETALTIAEKYSDELTAPTKDESEDSKQHDLREFLHKRATSSAHRIVAMLKGTDHREDS